jgi:protein deglycase
MDAIPRVLCLVFDGVEEIEAVTPVDLLRRAGVDVCVAAVGGGLEVRGRSGIVMRADAVRAEVDAGDFGMLVIPGGPGVAALRGDGAVARLAADFADGGRWVAAICAAPALLHDAGLLQGVGHTAHFSVHAEIGTPHPAPPVVRDGRIITARGAGTAMDFALELIRCLCGDDEAASVAAGIMV